MNTSRFIVSISLLIACCAASAPAQTSSKRQPVSEAQLLKLIPVLRMFVADVRLSQGDQTSPASLDEAVSARLALMQNIKDGKVDPLEWLTANSDYILYPSGVDYSASVSRLACELTMRPCAVFGFGMKASELGLVKVSGDGEALRKLVARGLDHADDQEKINTVVAELRRFYTERKIVRFEPESALSWSAQSPDSMITYTIMEANTYRAWENEDLPTGPILVLTWNESPEDVVIGEKTFTEALPALLEKARMTDLEFLNLVTALTVARQDTRNPARLKVNTDRQPQSEQEKKLLEEIQQILKVRTENFRLYKQYARTLDPLLDVFDEAKE
ncbi:MAG: hypothetical protein ACYC9O_07915 [Candidatus Latescibacterota bacterium]